MSVPSSNSELKKIQGSNPYSLTSSDGTVLGVNGFFVKEQFQKIATEGVISDVVQYLFFVSDESRKNPRSFVAKNTRMLLLAMLLHHVHALHVLRKTEGVPEFESDLVGKYKWFMTVDLQKDKEAKEAFEQFKQEVKADASNTLLDWDSFVGNVKKPVNFISTIKSGTINTALVSSATLSTATLSTATLSTAAVSTAAVSTAAVSILSTIAPVTVLSTVETTAPHIGGNMIYNAEFPGQLTNFPNIGNSCFLDSAIQMLRNIPELFDSAHINIPENYISNISSSTTFLQKYHRNVSFSTTETLSINVWKNIYTSDVMSLANVCNISSPITTQEDANFFLGNFIDRDSKFEGMYSSIIGSESSEKYLRRCGDDYEFSVGNEVTTYQYTHTIEDSKIGSNPIQTSKLFTSQNYTTSELLENVNSISSIIEKTECFNPDSTLKTVYAIDRKNFLINPKDYIIFYRQGSNAIEFTNFHSTIQYDNKSYQPISVVYKSGSATGGHYVCANKFGSEWKLYNDSHFEANKYGESITVGNDGLLYDRTKRKDNTNLIRMILFGPPQTIVQELQKSFATKVEYPAWAGAKCDSTGYFQHYGECWSDALQMSIFFTDKLKEFSQKRFYEFDFTDEQVSQAVESITSLKNISSRFKFSNIDTKLVKLYIQIIQRRFKRHYKNIVEGRKVLSECSSIDKPFEKLLGIEEKGRAGGLNAIGSAVLGRNIAYGEEIGKTKSRKDYSETKELRGAGDDAKVLLTCLVAKLLQIQFEIYLNDSTIINKENIGATTIYIHIFTKINEMLSTIHTKFMKSNSTHLGIYNETFKMGHAVLFYTCGNTYYYYEDYSGPSELPWNTLSEDNLSNLIFIPYYTTTKNNIEINYRNYPCINRNNELKTIDGTLLSKEDIIQNFTKYYTTLNNDKKQLLKDTLKLTEPPNDEEKVKAFYACSYKITSVMTQEIQSDSPLEVEDTGHEFTPSIRGKQSAGSLTVYWTRHALSCANVLKDLGKKGKRSGLAPNSSIADIGIEQCRQFKVQIQQVTGTNLDFVGASALLRAQQTAALLYNPETVHVLPYISEKRITLLPDDDNQPMSEKENTDMYQKFKDYMEGKYIFDTEEQKVKSVIKYEFKDMFGIGEKEAFKVKSDPMLILPKIYMKLKKDYPEKKDFHIAIVSHQGWLKDAGVTNNKIMNCGVVKQVFSINEKQTLVKESSEIIFPKTNQKPSIQLGGQEFTFTPTITPSLKDVLNPVWIQKLPEDKQIQILRSRCGSLQSKQFDYIPFGIQRKTIKNEINEPLEKLKSQIAVDINRSCAQYFYLTQEDKDFCHSTPNKAYNDSKSEAPTDIFKQYYAVLDAFYINYKYDYAQVHQDIIFDIVLNNKNYSQKILEYIFNVYLFDTSKKDSNKTHFEKILARIFPEMERDDDFGKTFKIKTIQLVFGCLFSAFSSKVIANYLNQIVIQTNPLFMLYLLRITFEDYMKEYPKWNEEAFYTVFYETMGKYIFFKQLSVNSQEEKDQLEKIKGILEFEQSEENRNKLEVSNTNKYLAQLVKRTFQRMIAKPPEQIIRSALTEDEYDAFQKEYGTIYSEPFVWTYIGICEVMQGNYITGVQAKPVQNFVRKTLKKGRNVGKAAANVTRKVGVKGKQAVTAVQQKVVPAIRQTLKRGKNATLSGIERITKRKERKAAAQQKAEEEEKKKKAIDSRNALKELLTKMGGNGRTIIPDVRKNMNSIPDYITNMKAYKNNDDNKLFTNLQKHLNTYKKKMIDTNKIQEKSRNTFLYEYDRIIESINNYNQ